jgi:hypothetical protein
MGLRTRALTTSARALTGASAMHPILTPILIGMTRRTACAVRSGMAILLGPPAMCGFVTFANISRRPPLRATVPATCRTKCMLVLLDFNNTLIIKRIDGKQLTGGLEFLFLVGPSWPPLIGEECEPWTFIGEAGRDSPSTCIGEGGRESTSIGEGGRGSTSIGEGGRDPPSTSIGEGGRDPPSTSIGEPARL